MASSSDYCRSILRVSVAQICQNLGWNATQTSTLELLTDVLERYLLELGKVSHRYCEQFGRTEPNLDDLGLTFRHLGINLGELEDYVRHVDPVPFAHEVVAFPAPKKNNLRFPNPRSREILQHRDEHVHDHLPYMFSGMEDEVPEERTSSPAPPSQPLTQDNTSMDTSSPSCTEKRPASASLDGPPSKRSRMMVSNLPEEAGHSQYEMTSVAMTNGFLTPIRGQGRLPDSRTPPPTIRHAITFTEGPGGASKNLDGSEANKENNALEPSSKDPVRVSIVTGKEPTVSVSSISGASSVGANSSSGGKADIAKSKVKKDGVKVKKTKKPASATMPMQGAGIPKSVAEGALQQTLVVPTPPLKKFKIPKIKEGKSSKGEKVKSGTKKKVPSLPPLDKQEDGLEPSRLKELLLSPNKMSALNSGQGGSSTEQLSKTVMDMNESVPSPNSTQGLMQAFPPTDIFDSHSSRENSPERLVIAEAEGRAQEKEEERQVRLKNIEDSINAVIRDSMAVKNEQTEVSGSKVPRAKKMVSTKGEKKEKVKKQKSKGKFKSVEFIADEVLKREAADAAALDKSMNDTIDSVIRQSIEQSSQKESLASAVQPPAVAAEHVALDKKVPKKVSKKKLDKDKSPTVKKKLKAKLQTKTGKGGELASPPLEPKPFVSDKYSTEELQVYEFADSPQEMPPTRRPSQAASPPPPAQSHPQVTSPHPPPPPSVPPPPPHVAPALADVKSPIKAQNEEAGLVTSPLASSASAIDILQVKPLKIEIPKEKERLEEKNRDKDRERSKERDHKRDKKERRKDKEKKKKNKDKDREKERKERHGHKEEKNKEDKVGGNLKIKIKFGSDSSGTSSSVMVTENKASPIDAALKQEPMPSPQRPEILKLVIRRDSGDTSSSQKKSGGTQHSSKLSNPTPPSMVPVKTEPVSSPSLPQVTSPSHWSPLSKTKSPPSRGRSSSPFHGSPVRASEEKKTASKSVRGRSPVRTHQSSPRETFSSSPFCSPGPGEKKKAYTHVHSPPPPTPSPPPKSPSPMPRTPSPARRRHSSSPVSVSSPLQHFPSPAPKSPTPTPKTPSLSPAYPPSSPFHPDHSPPRGHVRSPAARCLFGVPEKDTSSQPSPLSVDVSNKESAPDLETDSQHELLGKQKGKPGRPRSKSPRAKSPKGPKSPKMSGTKTSKPSKSSGGKGRGRPPKVKTVSKVSSETVTVESSLTEVSSKPVGAVKAELSNEKVPVPGPPSPLFTPDSPEQQEETTLTSDKTKGGSYGSQSRQRTVEAETLGFFIDPTTGTKIWVCPACKMQDDGSPMIGCDTCDDWYHWVCVNIEQEPPEEESWYCPRCSAKSRAKPKMLKPKGKRGRKKKVH